MPERGRGARTKPVRISRATEGGAGDRSTVAILNFLDVRVKEVGGNSKRGEPFFL